MMMKLLATFKRNLKGIDDNTPELIIQKSNFKKKPNCIC